MPVITCKMDPNQFLRVGVHHIQIAHITDIRIIELEGKEEITFTLISSPSIYLYNEEAVKYMTSLKAFIRSYGVIGLLEFAENLADDKAAILQEND